MKILLTKNQVINEARNEESEMTKSDSIAEPDISEYLAPEELDPDLSNTENSIFFLRKIKHLSYMLLTRVI